MNDASGIGGDSNLARPDEMIGLGWRVVYTQQMPPREGQLFGLDGLNLAAATRRFINTAYPAGIYGHQRDAIAHSIAGENVCLVTGTASGKSLAFQAAAIDRLARDPQARILACYPTKALGAEQTGRWERALETAGLKAQVGRIDGNVPMGTRLGILRQSRVIVATPDIVHAWLLSHLSERDILRFVKQIALIVIDEVHTYTGVFGSHAAFLFRRLQHIMRLFGTQPDYIAASATIARPDEHLSKLFAQTFTLITSEADTSPRQPVEIQLVMPPRPTSFLTELVSLLRQLASRRKGCFIAFADSRKQVELITSILARDHHAEADEVEAETEAQPAETQAVETLERLSVLPYRAGYEEADRDQIQRRLAQGNLCGVVATSALELGIDISYLDTCVLIGVPRSATSLWQRIGRIGRHAPGRVIVVHSGDIYDSAVFAAPESFLHRPPAESALYLENLFIQYIHALCLARQGGENDQAYIGASRKPPAEVTSKISWPDGFLQLCQAERTGQLPVELQSLKSEAGDIPNYSFPLRDIGSQFKVQVSVHGSSPGSGSRGSLSFEQLLREAYPGAVYYYLSAAYRVWKVALASKQVFVRPEKKFTTQPNTLPIMLFPNLQPGNVHQGQRHSALITLESNVMVRETVSGYVERRGANKFAVDYPLRPDTGCYFSQQYFTRNFFSTGVLLAHPALDREEVETRRLAELLYEAFLMLVPYERQDINWAADVNRTGMALGLAHDSHFLAIYDQTYGSLRLSARVLDGDGLVAILDQTYELAVQEALSLASLAALDEIRLAARAPGAPLLTGPAPAASQQVRVILPKSTGLYRRTGEEFSVERVFFTPQGLRYEGYVASLNTSRTAMMQMDVSRAATLAEAVSQSRAPRPSAARSSVTTLLPLIGEVAEIPGVSEIGLFDLETGLILPLPVEVAPVAEPAVATTPATERVPDTGQMQLVLSRHFSVDDLRALASTYQLNFDDLAGATTEAKVAALVAYCEARQATRALLLDMYALYKRQHV